MIGQCFLNYGSRNHSFYFNLDILITMTTKINLFFLKKISLRSTSLTVELKKKAHFAFQPTMAGSRHVDVPD